MEDNSESTTHALSNFSNHDYEFRSLGRELSDSKALNLLFLDETEWPFELGGPSRRQSVIINYDRNYGYLDESERSNMTVRRKNSVSYWDDLENKNTVLEHHLSSQIVDIEDEDFFISDVGKKMLLKDENEHEREFTLKPSLGCTPYSLWTVRSRKNLPDLENTCTSSPFCEKEYFNFYASSPIEKHRISSSFSEIKENILSANWDYECEYMPTPRIVNVFAEPKMSSILSDKKESFFSSNFDYHPKCMTSSGIVNLLPEPHFSLSPSRKEADYLDYYNYISSTNLKKIHKLKAEERKKTVDSYKEFPHNNSYTLESYSTLLPSCSSETVQTTLQPNFSASNLESFQSKLCECDVLIVKPQVLTLDINRGSRMLLINKSEKNLKFKTEFDGKITDVCPIEGNIPAKGEMGLRVLVSKFLRRKLIDEIEDQVKIVSGNLQKTVRVEIRKQQKNISKKERSFKVF